MNEDKIYRFGIIGCGMISSTHALAINSLPNAQLVGAVDKFPVSLQRFCERFGIKAYESEEALLQDENIDVICICTPSHLHAPCAINALNHAKHVVLEKPMALNTAEADLVIEACKRNNKMLTVISQMRFSEDVHTVRNLVAKQAFGKITNICLSMRYWRGEEYFAGSNWRGRLEFEGGGALMNQGIHGIDIMQYILGLPTVIKAKIGTMHHNVEVEDTAAALLQFPCGAIGTVIGSTCTYPGFERKLEIYGNKGFAIMCENKIEHLQTEQLHIDRRTLSARENDTSSKPDNNEHFEHAAQIANLLGAIEGREQLVIDAAEGRKALSVIEAIYTSAAE